ncbi:MAG TPA: hypothetical protein VMV79_04275 [Alphaproteobacteria bacterium]|nr:hypothetical protein [Alphaproteobacteria bacterium]
MQKIRQKNKPGSLAFMEKYGGNVAGFFWNAGTALQLVFGLAALSPREIVSACVNFASPASYLLFGHRNWGVAVGGILGIIGTFLAVYPQIAAGEAGSIFGFCAFCLCVSMSIFSAPLTHRFRHAGRKILRETFGHPRRLSGLGSFFFTRLPIIAECAAHQRWRLAAVFALWACGDLTLSFSRAEGLPLEAIRTLKP